MAQGRELPIVGGYGLQRFTQVNPEDAANWYAVPVANAKKKAAMYPTMGRRHIKNLGLNRLIFEIEPRASYTSTNYAYFVVGDIVYRVNKNFTALEVSSPEFTTISGNVWFATLYTPSLTYIGITDGLSMFVHTEETNAFVKITDPNTPPTPTYIAAYGNRFVVSSANSTQFSLSAINLGGGIPFDPTSCFSVGDPDPLAIFAQEEGIIRQMAVNKNILYIFTDFTTGVWANIPSTITNVVTQDLTQFPFKKNTSYQFQYGIGDPLSLSVDFGMMVWTGQTKSGLVQPVMSDGQQPIPISDKAIDVLFERDAQNSRLSPFVEFDANGFLYQYENTIFYRLSAGNYQDYKILDIRTQANAIEYNFDTKQWYRVIELNGERNRIQKHIYFNNMHLVTVIGDNTVYEMSGQFYSNELRNKDQDNAQALDAYIAYPFRYERVLPIISEPDYSEFETEWLQIDFCWGDATFIRTNAPFANSEFVVGEDGETYITDEEGNFIVTEGSNYPVANESTYYALFKPHIELYFSDDGGMTYDPADVLQFSDLGVYSWRMRWYQLGCSRNRVYKLIAVSPAPIVILGGWMLTKRVSGGAS